MALTISLARGPVLQLGGGNRPLLALRLTVVTVALMVVLGVLALRQLPLEVPNGILRHLVGVVVPYVGHVFRVQARAGPDLPDLAVSHGGGQWLGPR